MSPAARLTKHLTTTAPTRWALPACAVLTLHRIPVAQQRAIAALVRSHVRAHGLFPIDTDGAADYLRLVDAVADVIDGGATDDTLGRPAVVDGALYVGLFLGARLAAMGSV